MLRNSWSPFVIAINNLRAGRALTGEYGFLNGGGLRSSTVDGQGRMLVVDRSVVLSNFRAFAALWEQPIFVSQRCCARKIVVLTLVRSALWLKTVALFPCLDTT